MANLGITFTLLVAGGVIVYAGVTDNSIADVLFLRSENKGKDYTGQPSKVVNDQGELVDQSTSKDRTPPKSSGKWTAPSGGASSFKGAKSNLLDSLASQAQNQFGLRITATTNGGHVTGSYHFQGKAFDAAGSEKDMARFSYYVQAHYGSQITELIHNPGYAIKNGRRVSGPSVYSSVWGGHRDHVHVAAS